MTFQPDRVGPALLAQAHHTLTEAGLHVGHLVIAYDGQEDPTSYTVARHFHPVGHDPAFQYILASALRVVTPGTENPEVNVIYTRFFDDATVLVFPATVGDGEEGGEDDE